jgi:hypothetical protein
MRCHDWATGQITASHLLSVNYTAHNTARKEKFVMKVLKWIGYILGSLVVILLALGVFYFMSTQKLGNNYEVTPDPISVPNDEASIARGRHIAESMSDLKKCRGSTMAK